MINEIEELKIKLKKIIDKFLENDIHLLKIDSHESSLSFRIGSYLVEEFENWDVDMEYNRKGTEKKRIDKDNELSLFRPDLIVHKRNNDDYNYIVIQIKKNTYELNGDEVNKDRDYLKKLTLDNGLYDYRFGILLFFYCKQQSTTHPLIEYYENGLLIKQEESKN